MVCNGYAQIEGIEFHETISLVARLEAIRMILDFSNNDNIKEYQIQVKLFFPKEGLSE